MMWHELFAGDADAVREAYAGLDALGVENIHHFWYEPWHPRGAVIRVRSDLPESEILAATPCARIREWLDVASDEDQFGEDWPLVRIWLEVSSRLALTRPGYVESRRFVHLLLNQRGMDVLPEARFAARFGLRRLYVWAKCALGYLRNYDPSAR